MIKHVTLIRLLVCAGILVAPFLARGGDSFEQALKQLDATIPMSAELDSAYVGQIANLKDRLARTIDNDEQRYRLISNIFRRYQFFQADSALHYANLNLELAREMGSEERIWESTLLRADVLARSGMFIEAMNLLDNMPTAVPDEFKVEYYMARQNICQFASEYITDNEFAVVYFHKKMLYSDSIMQVASPNSFNYQSTRANVLIERDSKLDEAEEYITDALTYYKPGMREYSVLISQLAYAYSRMGDVNRQGECLALASISDINGCIKENMASRMLSNIMLDLNDIKRAKNYLDKSFVDANYYSARMRNTQSAAVLPLVTEAYEQLEADHQRLLVLIGVLMISIILAVVISYVIIHKKNKKLAASNLELHQKEADLTEANSSLNDALAQLSETNKRINDQKQLLEQSNKIKQAYLSQFIWLCSSTINKMSAYRNKLNLMVKAKNVDKLKDALNSSKDISDISSDFYKAFDEAFLAIIPDFNARLNALLREPLAAKSSTAEGKLSTEQRIYALINLGITDNQKIADFLHCTLSTVYTYRSKVKAKALDPSTLEDQVALF